MLRGEYRSFWLERFGTFQRVDMQSRVPSGRSVDSRWWEKPKREIMSSSWPPPLWMIFPIPPPPPSLLNFGSTVWTFWLRSSLLRSNVTPPIDPPSFAIAVVGTEMLTGKVFSFPLVLRDWSCIVWDCALDIKLMQQKERVAKSGRDAARYIGQDKDE